MCCSSNCRFAAQSIRHPDLRENPLCEGDFKRSVAGMKNPDIRIRKAQMADAEKMIYVHFNAVHGIPPKVKRRIDRLWLPDCAQSGLLENHVGR